MAMITQGTLSGSNAFFFLSLSALPNAPFSTEELAVKLSVAFGAVNFALGLVTFTLAPKYSRTTLLLLGLPIQAVLMFVLAMLFLMEEKNPARTPAIAAVRINPAQEFELEMLTLTPGHSAVRGSLQLHNGAGPLFPSFRECGSFGEGAQHGVERHVQYVSAGSDGARLSIPDEAFGLCRKHGNLCTC